MSTLRSKPLSIVKKELLRKAGLASPYFRTEEAGPAGHDFLLATVRQFRGWGEPTVGACGH